MEDSGGAIDRDEDGKSKSYKATTPHQQSKIDSQAHKNRNQPISFIMLLLGLIFAAFAVAQNSSSALTPSTTKAFDAGVPKNAALPGDYNGKWRPQVHFSPPANFINDPNGAFRDGNGIWHLYYQYNPTGTVAGNQHWGHATSKDLYTWQNEKIAIFAKPDAQIFSGSIVIDSNNTSGFFPNQENGVVAIYTLNMAAEQTQEIAYSHDGGYTFTNYTSNPVLRLSPPSLQFRDPKVIWYEDHWVMVIAYSQEFVIGIFTSPDLKEWTHASNFTNHGLLGLQYECPNLVKMPVRGEESIWLMAISLNPGAPLGGSITEYFPGSFNGTHFTAVDAAARLTDFGKDNYAGQYFYGVPETEDPVFIAWASNWQYAQQVPTGSEEGWRSAMSLPRTSHLIRNATRTGWALSSYPYDLSPVMSDSIASSQSLKNGSIIADYSTVSSGALYFQVNCTSIKPQGTLNFTLSASSTRESVSGGFYFEGDNPFWVSRANVLGFGQTNPFFTEKFSVGNTLNKDGTFTLEGVIDRSILEVFLDRGRNSGTFTFFPEGVLDTIEIRTAGLNEDALVSVGIWGLKSTWAPQAGSDGLVHGNVGGNQTQVIKRHF
ncbi:related to SUC2-invertase (sucrose hydrolyzing enzyme) [Rhynchosporium secalis]|uniref:Related to SUC2-invertase (Sucrose hydrolyzing enzyme) n=1 Tax=Rhynchosporium secalis TaxID=38038 RepID=A0A1E1MJP1_RHYSE|nr:related to SUC2-invertase (sucrose hydrolyzing enzyme) [Rhynchosporium secalis]